MSEFVENLQEVFALFGPVSARRMFGGYGIYHDGLMFALVTDDVLYLKADKQTVDRFLEQNLRPFEYDKKGKTVTMSYYTAPEEIFDDPEAAQEWAVRAFEAALRGRKAK
jgi:DNA transformation protein